MNPRYTILASTNGPLIGMQVDLVQGDLRETVLRQVIDTNEPSLRQALVKLGWTPPAQLPADE